MKLSTARLHAALGLALVFLSGCEATHAHRQHHQLFERRHSHGHAARHLEKAEALVEKRGGTCAFPEGDDPNLVAVTPDSDNAGWAMSPDQSCTYDTWCPYACKPGYVMAQWDPDATTTYPSSMNGGLYCDESGNLQKPFKSKDLCVQGAGTVKAVNKAGKDMSFCQTVYPGNEAMLIPSLVSTELTLAVPDTSYWCETSAHFYVNPPGTGEEGCIWGDDTISIGNWSPFVAGANADSNGNTFLTLGWNPEFEKSSILTSQKIDFALKVECPDGGCSGTPCGIDPSKGLDQVGSALAGTGDAGNEFCVVTVPKGSQAHIIAYTPGGDSSDDSDDSGIDIDISLGIEAQMATSTTTPTPEPTTTSTTSTTTPTPTPTTTSTTTTPTPTPTLSSTTPSFSTEPSTTSSTSKKFRPTVKPGIFHEHHNSTTSATGSASFTPTESQATSGTVDDEPASQTSSDDKDNEAGRQSSSPAFAGLVVAFVAAACFF